MSIKRRISSISLLLVLMLVIMSLSLSACKGKGSSEILLDSSKRYVADFKNICPITNIASDLLGKEYNLLSRDLTFIDINAFASDIFLLCTDPDSTFVVVLETGGSLRETFPVTLPEDAEPLRLFSGTDGVVYIFYKISGNGPWDIRYGGVAIHIRTGQPAPIDLSSLGSPVICDVAFNGTDTFAILTEETLFLTDTCGRIVEKLIVPKKSSFYQSVNFVEEKLVQALYMDSNSNLFLQTLSIDPVQTVRQEKLSGFVGTESLSAQLIASPLHASECVFIETESAIYGYNRQSKVFSKYLDKVLSDFYPITPFVHSGDERIMTIGMANLSSLDQSDINSVMQNYGVFAITFSEDDRPTQNVQVGICVQSPETVNHYLRQFQRTHPEYVFELIDYYAPQTTGDGENVIPIEAMYADLLSDHPPDILFIDPAEYERVASSDALTDMNSLIVQDELFDTSVFIENIWKAGETDGARYFISPFFSLNGMYAQSRITEAAYGKTLDEFGNYIQTLSEKPHIRQGNTPEEIAELFIEFHMRELILQSEDGQRLDIDRLRSIVTFSQKFGTLDDYESIPLQEQFAGGKILFLDNRLRTYATFLYDMEHDVGLDVNYISAPGSLENEPTIFSDMFISIPLASKQTEAVWAFVKFVLSPEIQDRYDDPDFSFGCMPIRKSSFDLMLESNYADYLRGVGPSVFDLRKSDVNLDQILSDPSLGSPAPPNPLPKKETIDAFRKLVCSARYYQLHYESVSRIISEELSLVFAGQKSTDEAIAVIDNRLQNYFGEGKK